MERLKIIQDLGVNIYGITGKSQSTSYIQINLIKIKSELNPIIDEYIEFLYKKQYDEFSYIITENKYFIRAKLFAGLVKYPQNITRSEIKKLCGNEDMLNTIYVRLYIIKETINSN